MQNTALSGVVGLSRLKQQISRSVVSSRLRHASMGHTLICGLGGTGKSLLARTIAKMLELPFYHIEAAELQSRRIVLDWILKCNGLSGSKSFVLFLDEYYILFLCQILLQLLPIQVTPLVAYFLYPRFPLYER